jgi:hypothetical protein
VQITEDIVAPVEAELGGFFPRRNDLRETFMLRWCRLRLRVHWGAELNLKVLLRVRRTDGVTESYLVDTDPEQGDWNRHVRVTRDFFLHPFPPEEGPVASVTFAWIAHLRGRSQCSRHEYSLADGARLEEAAPQRWVPPAHPVRLNTHRTQEAEPELLQRDVDWCNRDFGSLNLTPKFTKGCPGHPFHPKRYIHDAIDRVIGRRLADPGRPQFIKVCVDCIDDTDFVTHLLWARNCGVTVQCVVDWRKMTLTRSGNYRRLKRADIELTGVFCTPRGDGIEVAPDMHTKFILFGEDECLQGSFNIVFDRWGWNWESGMTFRSHGVTRLLDNIFQSIRGGVIQHYAVDPYSHFNLLYTFGRHSLADGRPYRPHQAILAEVGRARSSIRLCLFLLGELRGEHCESVIDALVHAHRRGVAVDVILNGHIAREGDPGRERTAEEEVARPLLPSVARLRRAGVEVGLAYGQVDHRVPYCPLHAKYAVIDDRVVLDGSFNWYNTSVHSHDLLVIAADKRVAAAFKHEFDQVRRLFRFLG